MRPRTAKAYTISGAKVPLTRVICPQCGRINTHGTGADGHELVAHCNCGIKFYKVKVVGTVHTEIDQVIMRGQYVADVVRFRANR